jgi:Capsule polysaccharide biosynthesis protein
MKTSERHTVVFTTLAINQTLFFEALGRALEGMGCQAAHICFHERSHEYLRRQGAHSFNAFALAEQAGADVDWDALGISNPAYLLATEKAAFELANTSHLLAKFGSYANAVGRALDALTEDGRQITMVQELGGLTSLLAAYFAARSRSIDNWFIEPSFFRGRVLLVRNSLEALPIGGPTGKSATPTVAAYLESTIRQQSAIIPRKDAHHYRAPWRKILDARHIRRLAEKSADKYVLGKREEYTHVGGHVRRHLKMLARSSLLARHYRSLEEVDSYVYYPLHVPADVAITLRSSQYIDQLALIDHLCRITPHPCKVAIKEHPALVGAIDYGRTKGLLRVHDNLVLLDARINNYAVLKRARAVITVNSKAGAEGLALGRPVLVLGDAFYRPCSLVWPIDRLQDLEPVLRSILRATASISQDEVLNYFQDVWEQTYPGELYVTEEKNIAAFARSLATALNVQGADNVQYIAR